MKSQPQYYPPMWASFMLYLGMGFIHEASHAVCAACLFGFSRVFYTEESSFLCMIRAFFCRQFFLQANDGLLDDDDDDDVERKIFLVRHTGWIFSLILAIGLHFAFLTTASSNSKQDNVSPGSRRVRKMMVSTAYITALEAIITDLCQLTPVTVMPQGNNSYSFFCGNFGAILLNACWGETNFDSALTMLQQMTRITMIRGAQSGGLVTFVEEHTSGGKRTEWKAIRNRVVNRKRTDLSNKLFAKVRQSMRFAPSNSNNSLASSTAKFFMGHTRFATTSVSDFPGTHPHQFTPRTNRKIYDLQTGSYSMSGVENFITHNGDFDYYELNGTTFDLVAVQDWLVCVLNRPLPASVDSNAIAGVVDILRTQGSFSLSVRYALCMGLPSSSMNPVESATLHMISNLSKNTNVDNYFDELAVIFEDALETFFDNRNGLGDPRTQAMTKLASGHSLRDDLASIVTSALKEKKWVPIQVLEPDIICVLDEDEEFGMDNHDDSVVPSKFARVVIDAFLDNDLFHTTKEFLSNAHGSFGLCVASSLDASSQLCLAARGQPTSVAFYPKEGVVLYGSEQSAVKAALQSSGIVTDSSEQETGNSNVIDKGSLRLDLDDLGGEVCLIDFSTTAVVKTSPVSCPHQNLAVHKFLNGRVRVVLWQQNRTGQPRDTLFHRCTQLGGNSFIQPLRNDPEDVVLSDIQRIPGVCEAIQKDWQNKCDGISFNRLTALNLSRSLVRRLDDIARGKIQRQAGTVDILLTGCEVSLWLAEQMASDLQKVFPRLRVHAVSSNKLLGLFGQEQSIPAMGFGMSTKTHVLTDSIVIIVSHSGGTFGPLAVSNLLQSTTQNIFAVTSEWDTQVGKQLRGMYDERNTLAYSSHIFTTGVGFAPAEPCSLSVAATQQLLTNIFQHICLVAISIPQYRHTTGALITTRDLQILERCNRDGILALQEIVGVDATGEPMVEYLVNKSKELRAMGDFWSEHVLENARAYFISFVYIVFTVTTGWPLITGIAVAFGAENELLFYILRFLDALFYFWLPQINITLLRIFQGRSLLHRMTARTVVIGDIPWVSQSMEAFVSKLFGCSYSIAGLNVYSGNPADHLVHRHTQRVVRGTLLVCGRPDGRLMALTSAESSVLLSVNQASSIQSWGGQCESITIGHNPYANPLCHHDIFLERHRPLFLCERILDPQKVDQSMYISTSQHRPVSNVSSLSKMADRRRISADKSEESLGSIFTGKSMSSAVISGKYSSLENERKQQLALKKKLRQFSTGLRQRAMAKTAEKAESNRLCKSYHSVAYDLGGKPKAGRRSGSIDRRRRRHSSSKTIDMSIKSVKSMTSDCGIGGDTSAFLKPLGDAPTARIDVLDIVDAMQAEEVEIAQLCKIFSDFDVHETGKLGIDAFCEAYETIDDSLPIEEVRMLFEESDFDGTGSIDFGEFLRLTTTPQLKLQAMKQKDIRDSVGLVQIEPTSGPFFDDDLYQKNIPGVSKIALAKSETLSMELYEARIASLQRFVSMAVLFHQLAFRVQSFFATISFGWWGYRIDRTHSMLRVATTASPTSGAHVRKQIEVLRLMTNLNRAADVIGGAWKRYQAQKVREILLLAASSNQYHAPPPPSPPTSRRPIITDC